MDLAMYMSFVGIPGLNIFLYPGDLMDSLEKSFEADRHKFDVLIIDSKIHDSKFFELKSEDIKGFNPNKTILGRKNKRDIFKSR
jgi:hypothetical protein